MPRKLCLIYANCQGKALGHFLYKSPCFQADYQIEFLPNYLLIQEQKEISTDLLKRAELFIYQPVRDEHGIYSTHHLVSHLRDTCPRLSFPYFYSDALWPLFRDGKRIVNASSITDLLDAGASVGDIALQFLRLQIDFRFEQRFQNSLRILAEKESATTVKVTPYILEHLKTERLFLTYNHPASGLMIHCANQMLSMLDHPTLQKEDHPHPNEAGLPGHFPLSPYEQVHYQLGYTDNWKDFYTSKREGSWKRYYLLKIMEICLSRYTEKHARYRYEKLFLKTLRSLADYLPS